MEVLTTLERQIEKNRHLVQDNPDDVNALMSYAIGCLRRDLRLEALQAFQKIQTIEPRPEASLALARIFCLQKHYAESYEELRRLFTVDPVNVQGHIVLHHLHGKESAPADLRQRLAFVPSREALDSCERALEFERDLLQREADEYESLLDSYNDPEPILVYYGEEAKKRVERVNEELHRCDDWSKLAVYMGDDVISYTPPMPVVASSAEYSTLAGVNTLDKFGEDEFKSGEDELGVFEDLPATEPDEAVQPEFGEAEVDIEAAGTEDTEEAVPAVVDEPQISDEVVVEPEVVEPDTGEQTADTQAETAIADEPEAAHASEQVETEAVEPSESVTEVAAGSAVEPEAVAAKPVKTSTTPTLSPIAVAGMNSCLERLAQTRGIERAMVMARDARLVAKYGDFDNVIELVGGVLNCINGLNSWPDKLGSVILESKAGLVFIQEIEEDYVLVVDTSASGLGALRHSVDKASGELSALVLG